MFELHDGTVTFLFTDIEGSTRLLKQLVDRYRTVLADQRRILRAAAEERGGREIDTQGDSFFVAFPARQRGAGSRGRRATSSRRARLARRHPGTRADGTAHGRAPGRGTELRRAGGAPCGADRSCRSRRPGAALERHPRAGRCGRHGFGPVLVVDRPGRDERDRLEASRLLADRGWGKAPNFEPLEGDPLDLEDLERAAEDSEQAEIP